MSWFHFFFKFHIKILKKKIFLSINEIKTNLSKFFNKTFEVTEKKFILMNHLDFTSVILSLARNSQFFLPHTTKLALNLNGLQNELICWLYHHHNNSLYFRLFLLQLIANSWPPVHFCSEDKNFSDAVRCSQTHRSLMIGNNSSKIF